MGYSNQLTISTEDVFLSLTVSLRCFQKQFATGLKFRKNVFSVVCDCGCMYSTVCIYISESKFNSSFSNIEGGGGGGGAEVICRFPEIWQFYQAI